MKKIDKYLLTSFVGPFVVSFGIALFVLVMQFLWLYIDEIAGKGVSVLILLELIGYMSISTFPMALPIAVLIASVMVLGNLSERYELSSMKSAGMPLIRIMRGLIFVCAGISMFSYFCSDYLIPVANLKFKSRLYDIRRQKPALTLEKGIFNEDFRQFVIRIGEKEKDGETIGDVMIDDQSNASKSRFNQILADSGQMYTTKDRRFFVMNLFDGTQYQEPGTQSGTQKQRYPFIRTNFRSWTKVWDMKEFEMVRTGEDRFSTQRSMLSMNELRKNMDSLQQVINGVGELAVSELLTNLKQKPIPRSGDKKTPSAPSHSTPLNASPDPAKSGQSSPKSLSDPPKTVSGGPKSLSDPPKKAELAPKSLKIKSKMDAAAAEAEAAKKKGPDLPVQELTKPLNQYSSLTETFRAEDRRKLLKESLTQAKVLKSTIETRIAQTENRRKDWVKTGYELYIKYSFALVCFLFLFIGAPMGAIIRKGGFGYPILVSIIFFVTFIFLTILCRKLAESYVMTPFWAAMMPCVGLAPIGIFLTRKAMNDSQMFSTERLERWLFRMRQRLEKNKTTTVPG